MQVRHQARTLKYHGRLTISPALYIVLSISRLRDLNAVYERLFPGLRYITFVNGRSRAQIVPEMEDLLGGDERVRERGSEEWKTECERAVGDVWKIGRKRLDGLMASD